jgi:hypothetical protein
MPKQPSRLLPRLMVDVARCYRTEKAITIMWHRSSKTQRAYIAVWGPMFQVLHTCMSALGRRPEPGRGKVRWLLFALFFAPAYCFHPKCLPYATQGHVRSFDRCPSPADCYHNSTPIHHTPLLVLEIVLRPRSDFLLSRPIPRSS